MDGTDMDAGVAQLVERLRNNAVDLTLEEEAADVIEYQAITLAQQATQLQEKDEEIRRLLAAWDNCRTTHESQLTSLRAELATAKTDAEDADNVRERLAALLSLTATALKGEPEPLHLHDWSDLPKRVEALRAELETAQRKRDAAEVALAEAHCELDEMTPKLAEANRKLSEAAFTSLTLLHRASTAEADFADEKLETERLHAALETAESALAEARRALDAEQQDNTRLLAALDAIGARHNAGPYPRKEDHHEP